MLKIDSVRQRFRTGFWMKEVEILKGISYEVPKGSIFGFLGPNGAGKTTLIHLIVGIRRPVEGRVTLDGVDCQDPAARARIGYLPERPYFYEHLTGKGILRYFGSLSGMTKAEIEARIPGVLEDVGMSHAGDLELRKYSKGMLQRIGIGQALIHSPDFLVLDEPVSGLDPVGRKEMRELIRKLSREGKTIFFSSHVIPDVEAICDQIAVIKKGELVGSGPIKNFLKIEKADREIQVAGLSHDALAKISGLKNFTPIPEGMRAICPASVDLNATLNAIIQAKGNLISVNPIRPTLEDFFT